MCQYNNIWQILYVIDLQFLILMTLEIMYVVHNGY